MNRESEEIRQASIAVPAHLGSFDAIRHDVLGTRLTGPLPEGVSQAIFALGCFWGAERRFWQKPGVHATAVGYTGGHKADPDYYSVCSGVTGHAEAVLVSYDVSAVSYKELLAVFWEAHDPTQGMRQGNDIGTQYRSGIYTLGADQQRLALAFRQTFGDALRASGFGPITTEIAAADVFYLAEEYHQQYLAKNPGGYCGLGGTGVACEIESGLIEGAALAE